MAFYQKKFEDRVAYTMMTTGTYREQDFRMLLFKYMEENPPKGDLLKECNIKEFIDGLRKELKGFATVTKRSISNYGKGGGYRQGYQVKTKNSAYGILIVTDEEDDMSTHYIAADFHDPTGMILDSGNISIKYSPKTVADWYRMVDADLYSKAKKEFDEILLRVQQRNTVKKIGRNAFLALFNEKKQQRDCTLTIRNDGAAETNDRFFCHLQLGKWVNMDFDLPSASTDFEKVADHLIGIYDSYNNSNR